MTWTIHSLLNRMRFVVEVKTVGGILSGPMGPSCSRSVFSAPVVSVSMEEFGLEGSLATVDARTGFSGLSGCLRGIRYFSIFS
jgi:hypothetical protein